jgi:hypothetical protein
MSNDIEKQLDYFKNKNIEEELQKAYKNAEQFSLIPLLKLIYLTTKIDLHREFKLKHKLSSEKSNTLKGGEILMTKDKKNIKVYLDIVDKDYDLLDSINNCQLLSENVFNLANEPNDSLKNQIISIITFLTQSIKVVFDSLKNKYQELTEYNLTLSENTTIYLDYELLNRIGVKFEINSESNSEINSESNSEINS